MLKCGGCTTSNGFQLFVMWCGVMLFFLQIIYLYVYACVYIYIYMYVLTILCYSDICCNTGCYVCFAPIICVVYMHAFMRTYQ